MNDNVIEWGLSFGSHDSAISVFINDQLVFATEGERWSGIKHDKQLPPNLLNFLRTTYGKPAKIYYFEDHYKKEHRRKEAGQPSKPKPSIWNGNDVFHYDSWILTGHHHSHASWGYYTSPFDKCTTLVIDSIGEWDTMSVWKCANGKMTKISGWTYPQSLGLMYTAATIAGGWRGNDEEYKMMGASALGNGDKEYNILKELFDSKYNFHKGWVYEGDRFEIAAGAQKLYEKWLHNITTNITGPIVLTGGCALNVRANMLIKNDLYVPPAPNDAGSAIGCVLAHKKQKLDISPYLGYNIMKPIVLEEIGKELTDDGIVGVAHGKCEFGPRALGNRSILANPRKRHWKERLCKIKNRSSWRPFGCIVKEEDVNKYFLRGKPSPYMNTCFFANQNMNDFPVELLHEDQTVRVQTITSDHYLYPLLNDFPVLINTSLNINGKPICNNEQDVEDFKRETGIAVL